MKKFTILAAAVLPLLASATASAAVVSFSDSVFNPSDCPSVHPDFSQLFTLGVQSSISLAGAHGAVDATVRIDNLSVQVLSAPPQVPLPAGVWLLGSGLAGLGALRRRLTR